ncbi:MAG: hypothetical protein FJ102_21845, partial [Deltaproteobacteria bacterium]|nr:hypothetical protein [Deltaproteobacteria bacterium]
MGDGSSLGAPSRGKARAGSASGLDALLVLCAVVSSGVTLLVAGFVARESTHALRVVGLSRWFGDPSWHPASGLYNALPMVVGTLLTSMLALALAVPVGVLSAAWAQWVAPAWARGPYRALVALLAGIPSVVYGLWGLTVLVPAIARVQAPGSSLLAGALVLALMVVPTIALFAESAL